MLIIDSYTVAIACLFITMICWGSWANTQKLAGKLWPFQLFYWDYALGIVLFALVFGLTAGSIGEEGRSFIEDLWQGSKGSYTNALAGGIIFNIANLLLVASIDIAGMAVAFPVGIGLALIIGVVVNYYWTPIGDPILLFAGVLCVVLAIILDARAYRHISKDQKISSLGIWLALLAGILMGFFYRFVAAATSLNFQDPQEGLFTPYTSVFIFSLGVFLSNFLWNSLFMRFPIQGAKIRFSDYFRKGNPKLHLIGLLGGIVWCIGMSLSILSSSEAGFAISYGLGQGATMVAAIWGVFVWKEFKGASRPTLNLIYLMFFFFVIGIVLIILSRIAS